MEVGDANKGSLFNSLVLWEVVIQRYYALGESWGTIN